MYLRQKRLPVNQINTKEPVRVHRGSTLDHRYILIRTYLHNIHLNIFITHYNERRPPQRNKGNVVDQTWYRSSNIDFPNSSGVWDTTQTSGLEIDSVENPDKYKNSLRVRCRRRTVILPSVCRLDFVHESCSREQPQSKLNLTVWSRDHRYVTRVQFYSTTIHSLEKWDVRLLLSKKYIASSLIGHRELIF